ncbi:MAG: enoyl-CoA hydratase/isomerase family protein [Candidatus Omnitrophica bacterium]|nr:enoyl-CoA hydratase/isomerase family protein [Candidatus Omnitrophota bacterium]
MSITYHENNNTGFIEFDQKDSKVNLLSAEILKELAAALEEARRKPHLKALVIASKKKDVFIAGADIKEIEGITQPEEGRQKAKAGQGILNKLEDLPVPTIAVIDGVALGGGCELALACQYRLATFNEKVRIGLPEVNLGIFPAFGGTYRLPRLIGLPEAMTMILTGKPVDAKKALRLGLVDRLAPQNGLDRSLNEFIEDILKGRIISNKYARRKARGLPAFLETSFLGQWLIFRRSVQSVLKNTKGFYPAPLQAIAVIKKNFYLDRTKGLEAEARGFGELATTAISKNLIHVFYISEQCRKLTVEGVSPARIEKCGVLGAGVMGGGIAQLLSYSDIWVRLKDINYDALALGVRSAAKLYRDAVKKRRMKPHEAVVKMDKITTTLDYSGFTNADIVIEAVVENMEVKRKVFRELSAAVGPQTILATNTSALSVTEMAKETKDPAKVIGLHFFNPVHKMPLVEIITTAHTSKETLASTLTLVKRLGKTPIVVKDSCGFVVNRILLGYINEAGRLLEEGLSIVAVDKIMTDFGMPMGPFTLTDEVGLDVGSKVLHILEKGLGERFKPVDIFEKVCARGFLGKKSGKGFYLYQGQHVPNPAVTAGTKPGDGAASDNEEALRRMLYLMINEAARCLEEGIVDAPGAIDVGMIFGTGFPAFHGGLLRYADTIGLAPIVAELNRLRDKFQAERFRPAAYLMKLQDEKKKFYQ